MKILNLCYPDKSEIKFRKIQYPDGQQQIIITEFEQGGPFKWEQSVLAYPVTINSRLNSFKDLELIICTKKALDNLGFNNINLYTPYFLGSRSDRQFENGSNNYLKDVICPIINNLNFDSLTVLDPHSNCLEMGLNNFKKISNESLFRETIRSLYGLVEARKNDDFILVSPDAGATHKIYKLAQDVDYKGDIITCSKERDKDGKLTKCIIPGFNTDHNNKDLIIIDDICDGGGTFLNIAKKIRKGAFKGKLYLIVTHGIFSKALIELEQYFDSIYCTNSFRDLPKNMPFVHKVKQLNIF